MKRSKISHVEDWNKGEQKLLKSFRHPIDIQTFVNALPYNDQHCCKSPRYVIEKHTAHCAEGAYFAAAALRFMGFKPLIVDMLAENDDDHLIAVFKQGRYWGAIAKSNTTLLRFREPVYRTLRELVMSYFEFYFNTLGFKSLRSYSAPMDISRFDGMNWMTTAEDLECIGSHLGQLRHFPLLSPDQIQSLAMADPDVVKACFLGANENGLYKPQS